MLGKLKDLLSPQKKGKMSLNDVKSDLKALIAEKNCGPIFIRLSWHDAGVYSTGNKAGGESRFGVAKKICSCTAHYRTTVYTFRKWCVHQLCS